jgi:signal peptidase I
MVLSFGSIEADNDERMAPAIEPGEILVYHRYLSDRDLRRGAVILFKLPPHAQGATPGEMVIARILAGPDDDLTVRDGRYVVNGEETRYRTKATPHRAPLVVPAYPRKLIVPDSRYFVVQDSLDTGIDSQQLDYARRIDIVSARLFHFGSHGLMRPAE